MPFKEGEGGRPKGATNTTNRLVKEVFASAFGELQKDPSANIISWGKDNPTEFYKLASKLIPIQLASDPENPITNPAAVINVYSSSVPLSASEEDINDGR